MKRPIVTVIAIIAASIGGGIGKDLAKYYLDRNNDITSEQFLSKLASEMNKKTPIVVDKETELISTVGLQGVFVYNYRLVNMEATRLDSGRLLSSIRDQIQAVACTTPQTRDTFLKKGVILRYSYYDKKRAHIGSIDVRPTDCGF